MLRRPAAYPAVYREQIIALARSGRSAKERAKEFEPSEQTIRFMSANQALAPIATMCRAFGVSESGFHAWRHRGPSARARHDVVLRMAIRAAHARSNGTYGAPRLLEDLRDAGHHVGQKRVARLMRAEGLHGVSKRRGPAHPRRVTPESPPAPDLVTRACRATAPNQLWVADITYIPTAAGLLYLAIVLDVFSRRVIGWAMRDTLHTTVVLDALDMAAMQRCAMEVVGSRGDAYDNAMAESFFSTLECECLAKLALRRTPKRAWCASATSRAGTIRTVGIPPSASAPR